MLEHHFNNTNHQRPVINVYLFTIFKQNFLFMNIGETFILFNQQMKGNRRELIQFGVPIFGHIKEEATSNSQIGKTYFLILLDFIFPQICDSLKDNYT